MFTFLSLGAFCLSFGPYFPSAAQACGFCVHGITSILRSPFHAVSLGSSGLILFSLHGFHSPLPCFFSWFGLFRPHPPWWQVTLQSASVSKSSDGLPSLVTVTAMHECLPPACSTLTLTVIHDKPSASYTEEVPGPGRHVYFPPPPMLATSGLWLCSPFHPEPSVVPD